jgi:DNA topoisomerase-1
MENIIAKQEYMRPPIRFTQASLVKKLEELGIGRPATYVNSIKTILDRGYVETGNVPGIKKDITILQIKSKNNKHVMEIDESQTEILLGKEMKKILPTELGKLVTEYLLQNFAMLIDYKFTAKMEADMDEVANGNKVWQNIVKKFYNKLNPLVEQFKSEPSIRSSSARVLGLDSDENEISAVITKNGPAIVRTIEKKAYYANIPKGVKIEDIDLETAINLLNDAVRVLGTYENADVTIRKSKAGAHYISYGAKKYCPIPPNTIIDSIKLKSAIKLIKISASNVIAEFNIKGSVATVLKGKGTYPPYIQVVAGKNKKFYSIPKSIDASELTEKKVLAIISTPVKKNPTKKVPTKKIPMKKVTK